METPGFTRFVDVAPGERVPNDQLQFGNIFERTHIRSRNIAAPKDTEQSLGEEAVRLLFDQLGIKGGDCEGLVFGSCTAGNERKEKAVTAIAKQIATRLGIAGDAKGVNYACSGFPAAVEQGKMLAKETDRHVILVWAEILSRIVDWRDEATSILFGDRAAACSLAPDGHPILIAHAEAFDDPAQLINLFKREDALDFHGNVAPRPCIEMFGPALYKHAPREMADLVLASGIRAEDVQHVVPHQANGKFMQYISKHLGADWAGKTVDLIEQRGNTASCSIPNALTDLQDSFEPGKIVVCPSIGGAPDFTPRQLSRGLVAFRVKRD